MKFLYLIALCVPLVASAFQFHREEKFSLTTVPYAYRTTGESCEDAHLVGRIINAYQLAQKDHLGVSMWQIFYQRLQDIHNVFQKGDLDQATQILRNPGQTDLFFGIDNLCQSILPRQLTYEGLVGSANGPLDCFLRCAEAMGAVRLDNPENYVALPKQWTADEILKTIESYLGVCIHFPNPYPDEVGVYTCKGAASYRVIQALYQAYRIKELVKNVPHPRVLEIGAGLGRTAYYCRLLGICDYTIIDIPMTALASSYFLGRTLGEEQIVLLGESLVASENKVKILTPAQFLSDTSQYDLIVNVDSLTEMDPRTIESYLGKIQQLCPMFLSINHETNQHSVFEFLSSSSHLNRSQRYPYWLRLGYLEELYVFNKN